MCSVQSIRELVAARHLGSSAHHSDLLLEENFSHHAFVLMAQQLAVEKRYAPDDRAGEIFIRSTFPSTGTFTVSSHSGSLSRTPFWP
jgi:hypothetical protein